MNHGWAAAVRTARDRLKRKLRRQRPGDTTTWLPTAQHEFDVHYGVDTSGLVWAQI